LDRRLWWERISSEGRTRTRVHLSSAASPGRRVPRTRSVRGIASQREEDETRQSVHGLPRDDDDLENAGIHITGLGDASEMLDEHAKAAYRRRLSELREELKEAKELGNVERAEQAEEEIDALTRELSRAVGLGGRNRRAASASERAWQSITKSIETVIERIAQSEATLGDLLSRCIKTGTLCSYQPDPDFPLAWEFAQTPIEQAEQATSSRDLVAVDSDHRQVPPVVLDVSPFSLAERTAIVGRETERRAIRVVIDRARSGHGSLVMLGGEPGVGRTRLAMDIADYARSVSFRSFVGHCYETDEPFPHLPFVEIIESGLAHTASLDYCRQVIGDNTAELAQIAPRLRRIFPIFRNHWNCRRRGGVAFFSRAFLRRCAERHEYVHSYSSLTPPLGRRIDAGSFDSSRQSHRSAFSRNHRDLS